MHVPGGDEGNTPLDDDERDALVPAHLTTQAELNQWEANNIARAREWVGRRIVNVLDIAVMKALHRRMFDKTWKWAGAYRTSDKNISPFHWPDVARLMDDLVANTVVQYDSSDKAPSSIDDIAIRFHHSLVHIHPWHNGNGRHARVATDLLLRRWGQPPFSWGAGSGLIAGGDARSAYISALKAADAGHFSQLRKFVRS